MALLGVILLPQHQWQKVVHYAWYRLFKDLLEGVAISFANFSETPAFLLSYWIILKFEALSLPVPGDTSLHGSEEVPYLQQNTRIMESLKAAITLFGTFLIKENGRNMYTCRWSYAYYEAYCFHHGTWNWWTAYWQVPAHVCGKQATTGLPNI